AAPRCVGAFVLATSSEWVEQDSNLRRLSHQIYSLAPLAAWVSTRIRSTHRRAPARLRPKPRLNRKPNRAGGESRTHNRRFTKPVLCRLSYASVRKAVKFLTITPRSPDARAFRSTT